MHGLTEGYFGRCFFVPYASPDFPEERGNCFGLGFTALPAQQWSRDVVARDGGEEEAPRWPTTNHPTFVRLAEGAATECAWGKRQRQGLITADFFFFFSRQAGDTGDAGDTGGWNVNRVLSCSCLKAPCLCVAFSPVLFIHLCGHQPLPPDAWAAIRAEHLTQLARHTVTPHGLRVAQVNIPPFCQARAISPHHRS